MIDLFIFKNKTIFCRYFTQQIIFKLCNFKFFKSTKLKWLYHILLDLIIIFLISINANDIVNIFSIYIYIFVQFNFHLLYAFMNIQKAEFEHYSMKYLIIHLKIIKAIFLTLFKRRHFKKNLWFYFKYNECYIAHISLRPLTLDIWISIEL